MHPARIAELLEPFLGPANDQRLTTNDLLQISTYIDLLLRWNSRINLTAIRDPEEIVTRHFGESLFAARHLFPRASSVPLVSPVLKAFEVDVDVDSTATVADVGSGPGFPGIPIKLWAPAISLTLIESNQKKAMFLRELTRALTLTNVNIQNARAQNLPQNSFALVTLRAVEHFADILPVAASLVAPGGHLALLISSAQFDQARASLLHLSWSEPTPVPVPLSHSRILAVAHRPPEPF